MLPAGEPGARLERRLEQGRARPGHGRAGRAAQAGTGAQVLRRCASPAQLRIGGAGENEPRELF